jgi:hypothetical protein
MFGKRVNKPHSAAAAGAMEMTPQAHEKMVFGDGNGAIR